MTELPNKILMATDGSEDSTLALRAATDIANAAGSALHLVHAWQEPTHSQSGATTAKSGPERAARELLRRQARLARAAGATVAGEHLRKGNPAQEITDLAEEIGAGMVVVGSRGLGALKPLVLGSVSKEIVRAASRPVLVVRGEWPPSRIVVGDDLSEAAGRAGKIAAGIGELYGAPVLLTMAYLPGKWYIDYAAHNRRARETERGIGQKLHGRSDSLGRALEKKPATEVAPRDPDDMLREASEESATLVAVGSRGLGVAKRALLGSVSDGVLKAAGGPVLIAPSPEDAGSPKGDNAPEHPPHRGRQAPAPKTPRRSNANTRAGGYRDGKVSGQDAHNLPRTVIACSPRWPGPWPWTEAASPPPWPSC
jgi:nucleotide-binding universal stress UspA family protein